MRDIRVSRTAPARSPAPHPPAPRVCPALQGYTGSVSDPPDPPQNMSMGPSCLVIHERPNGDIGLALPNQNQDLYVLRTGVKPGPGRRGCTQEVVRSKDDAVLACVSWVEPKRDMVKLENAAYMTPNQGGDSWMRLDHAWKAARPTRGDCVENFTGSDDRPYEWKLELRNMRKRSSLGRDAKLYGPDRTEHIATETQFTPRGHVLEMNPVDCVGVGEMLYVTLLISLARRRHRRRRGLSGVVSRAVENVLFM